MQNLEQRFDGIIPAFDPAQALLVWAPARHASLQRMAQSTHNSLRLRRQKLLAAQSATDHRLGQLSQRLTQQRLWAMESYAMEIGHKKTDAP